MQRTERLAGLEDDSRCGRTRTGVIPCVHLQGPSVEQSILTPDSFLCGLPATPRLLDCNRAIGCRRSRTLCPEATERMLPSGLIASDAMGFPARHKHHTATLFLTALG